MILSEVKQSTTMKRKTTDDVAWFVTLEARRADMRERRWEGSGGQGRGAAFMDSNSIFCIHDI
jgi:hypothetical protein